MTTLHDVLQETAGACALLESTTTAGPLARRSILARHPRAILVADGTGSRIVTSAGTHRHRGDPLDHLRALAREVWGEAPPAEAGIVGALSYDYMRPRQAAPDAPRLLALAVDRLEIDDPQARVTGAPLDALLSPAAPEPAKVAADLADLAAYSNVNLEEYRRMVQRAKEHIAAGDIYQANVSQRFQVPWERSGLDLYSRLRVTSPAPFAGYLRVGAFEIVSASPERLLLVDGGRLSTRPIAGTRPRSSDPGADRALAADLLLSEKERAEHLMLVDLARNDVGRVAEMGSVAVDELMIVEDYSHVRHIVSNVTGRLAPGRDALDALRAVFPGGTITGVPKVRCMEILDSLEPGPRGFYTGSLFYQEAGGRLDANILIRSATVTGGTATFHAGGGIVADSEPDLEYAETLHKAEGMRVAIESALKYHPP
jgi:para-aminobenzoate synthetase component 1